MSVERFSNCGDDEAGGQDGVGVAPPAAQRHGVAWPTAFPVVARATKDGDAVNHGSQA